MPSNPRLSSRWIVEHAGADALAYDRDSDDVHLLSAEAAALVAKLDGTRTLCEASTASGLGAARADQLLAELSDLGMLEGLTRRAALQRTAMVGGGVLAATLVTPLAAAHASLVGGGTVPGPTYSQAVLASTPLAYYRLNETSGTAAADASGHGKTGTYVSAVNSVAGATTDNDKAFYAISSYVAIPNSLSASSSYTIEFWLKTSNASGVNATQYFQGMGLVDGEMPGVVNDMGVTLDGGKVLFGQGNSSTNIDTTIFSGSIANGAWHHVAATSSAGAMVLYIDGVSVATASSGATQPRSSPNDLRIGRQHTSSTPFPNAVIDEVALYGSALSSATINAHIAAR